MNTDDLRELIAKYLDAVSEVKQLFVTRFGEQKLLRAWHSGAIAQEGWLDEERQIKYFFHGSGCRVESPTINVDFDFLPEGEGEGFDLWRLHDFAHQGIDSAPEFRDEASLRVAFEQLISTGEIRRFGKAPSPHLYRLESPINRA